MRRKILATAVALSACNGGDESGSTPPRLERPSGSDSVILFLGTSLTAGYGVGEANAFPALIEQKIDSAGLDYRVVNAGVSGETSAGARRRINWVLQQPLAVLVIESGANDGLRGLPPDSLRANLDHIIELTREIRPQARILLTGMEAPPNLGDEYTGRFRAVYRELAADHGLELIPFLLEGVAGHPDRNLSDGIHPNPAGHRTIAATVWSRLEPLLPSDDTVSAN